MESNRPEMKSGQIDWVWLLISIGLYILSTIGLANGSGAGLSFGIEGTTEHAYTISASTAIFLGWLVAIIIQIYETKVLVNWKKEEEFEKFVAKAMFVLDFLAICLALGIHMNIIWMVQNHSVNIPGMVVHVFGLIVQLFIAFLGSVVAEMAFAKAVGSLGNLPQIGIDIMKMLQRRRVNRIDRSTGKPGDSQWQPLPPGVEISRIVRELRGSGMVLVYGDDGQLHIVSKDDPRMTAQTGQTRRFSAEAVG
jgi:hypothetical protein